MKPHTCPSCGAARVVPIVYGEPKPATVRAAALELLLTWGCVMHSDLPRWACLACEHHSGRLDDMGARSWNAAIASSNEKGSNRVGGTPRVV